MNWTRRLFDPVDIASLVAFRIAFGLCLIVHMNKHVRSRSFYFDAAAPSLHFPHPGFSWLRPVSEDLMQVFLVGMLIAAVGITLGLAYRLSCFAYTLGAAYFHFMDAARFHNHYYLILLVTLLLTLMPAHGAFSIDAALRPALRRSTAPRWTIWLLRFQLGIPYLFSGLSKLNYEWLHGTPAIFFWYSFALAHEWARSWNPFPMALLIAWGGALSDTFLLPLLLWRRTRPLALGLAVLFNLGNAALFSGPLFRVEMFPWFMMGAMAVYPDPGWPRRLIRRFRHRAVPVSPGASPAALPASLTPSQRLALAALALYALFQVLMPLRHHLYPGNHLWNESGRTYAWQMMSARKMALTTFIVTDPATGQTWERSAAGAVDGDRLAAVMRRPYLIHLYARHIREEMAALGYPDVEVRAESFATFNGRPPQRMIDPEVDVSRSPGRWGYFPWVLPLAEPPVPLRSLDFQSAMPQLAPAGSD